MNPIIIKIGPLTLRWYGVLVATGFFLGHQLIVRRAKKSRLNLNPEQVSNLVFGAMLGGILGARIFYVLQYWEQYSDDLISIIRIYQGGLVFYGGFIGAALTTILIARKNGWNLLELGDLVIPALPLGHAFGRIGCLLNGCCYGKSFAGTCAMHYHQKENVIISVFPIQAVASLYNFIICTILILIDKKQKGKIRGTLFGYYLIMYSIARFTVEFWRGDYHKSDMHHLLGMSLFGTFTPAQRICFFILPVGIIWTIAVFKINKKYSLKQQKTKQTKQKTTEKTK